MQSLQPNEITHAILTCYDDRLDELIEMEVARIRMEGGQLRDKDIIRPPGGVHLLAGHTDCRRAFYQMMSGLRDIARRQVIHLFPHTNCQYCGIHFQEKLGNGSRSDLRFHVTSAEKMLNGAMGYFSGLNGSIPELDVRIILTVDRQIVTIDEARSLLPHVPESSHHGAPCVHRGSHPHHGHVVGNGHDPNHLNTHI